MSKDGFVFYRGWYDSIRELEPQDFKECFMAIADYGLNGVDSANTPLSKMYLNMAKRQLDINQKRYEAGKKPKKKQDEPQKKEPPEEKAEPIKAEKVDEFKAKATEVLQYFCKVTGASIRKPDSYLKDIMPRLKEGYSVDDCKTVIDKKYKEWHGTEMQGYIRVKTLFAPSHFDEYLNQQGQGTRRTTVIDLPDYVENQLNGYYDNQPKEKADKELLEELEKLKSETKGKEETKQLNILEDELPF